MPGDLAAWLVTEAGLELELLSSDPFPNGYIS